MKRILGAILLSLLIAACGSDSPPNQLCTVRDNGDGTATVVCPDGTRVTVGPDEDVGLADVDAIDDVVAGDALVEPIADVGMDTQIDVAVEDVEQDLSDDGPTDVLEDVVDLPDDIEEDAGDAIVADSEPDADASPDVPDTIPPSLRFVHPVDGLSVGGEVNVVVEATDDRLLDYAELLLGSESLAMWDSAPYEFAWDTAILMAGSYDLVARAVDLAGNETSARVRVWVIGTCTDGGDCPPDQVRVIRPVHGAIVCGDITIEAIARDDVGIDRIEFRLDDTLVDTVEAAPFSFEWDTTRYSEGPHTIEAIAYDTLDQPAFAAIPVEILNEGEGCDNQPNVWFTSPEDGDHLTGIAEVEVGVWDDVGVLGVGFFVDLGRILYDSSAPYAIEWDTGGLEEGTHTLKALATDTAEQDAEAQITVTVDRTPPDVELTSPSNEGYYGNSVLLSALASDNNAVYRFEYWVNGTGYDDGAPAAVLDSEPWETDYDATALPSGWHRVRGTAYDLAGNDAFDDVDFLLDRPPTVSFVAPSEGEKVEGPITVRVDANDDRGISSADLLVDDVSLGAFDGAGELLWTPEYLVGDRTLKAVVIDLVGQRGEATVTVSVDHPLEVKLLRCEEETCAEIEPDEVEGAVTLEVWTGDDDGSVTRVEYTAGGTLVFTANTETWRYEWDSTTVSDGELTVTATAFSDNGTDASDSVLLVVNNCDKDHDTYVEQSDLCGGDDCQDRNGDIHPGVVDVCDGENNDCTGVADDGTEEDLGCRTDQECREGSCQCAVSDVECDGVCRGPAWFVDNNDHCGECDNACTEPLSECVVDTCTVCPGQVACDGACHDAAWFVDNDDHCGECDNGCTEALSECVTDECVVCPGEVACDGACREVSWFVDNDDHCGECDNACTESLSECVVDTCTVCPGQVACDGACRDAAWFVDNDGHCGVCDNACEPFDEVCDVDQCVCAEGRELCGEVCIDTVRNPENCGTCDYACPEETPFCVNSECEPPPPEGFVYISPGTFTMGSPPDEPGGYRDEVQHEVTLTRPSVLRAYEVSQGEWRRLMGTDPSFFRACGDDCPVEGVSWNEALAYCNALSVEQALPECYDLSRCSGTAGHDFVCSGDPTVLAPDADPYQCEGYRLPTEAEWEYAYRAGTTTALYCGAVLSGCLIEIAWYNTFAPHAVGTKLSNTWGLFDMAGNVGELVWDRYEIYPLEPSVDPIGIGSGNRVVRGGTWGSDRYNCRAAKRWAAMNASSTHDAIGFRPARTVFQ